MAYYITMTSWWARWRLKSPASLLLTQPFIQAQIKEKNKAPRPWPLCGEIHWWPMNSPHKWPVTRKMFPFDDVIMQRWHINPARRVNPTQPHKHTLRQTFLNQADVNAWATSYTGLDTRFTIWQSICGHFNKCIPAYCSYENNGTGVIIVKVYS